MIYCRVYLIKNKYKQMKWLKIVQKMTNKTLKIDFINFISYKMCKKSNKKLTFCRKVIS